MRCSMTILVTLLVGELLAVPAILLTTPAAAITPAGLTLEFRDEAGLPIPVRAAVFTGLGSQPPLNPADHLYQQLGSQSYFYCDGDAQVDVAPGWVTIRAGHGFEYQARDTALVVAGNKTVTMTLKRFVDLQTMGWYSGDTHVHISHPPDLYILDATDLLLAADGEDLNVVNAMEDQTDFTGALDPVSRPERLVYFSKEQRNAHFSHLAVVGLKQWIYDQGCVVTDVACGKTLDAVIHAQVHAQPGETAVIATHPFSTFNFFDTSPWPGGGVWRGMAIDLPAGAVDAVDLLTYTNALPPAGIAPYLHILNAGFRLPPAAGTDCALCSGQSKPLGGYRLYVKTGAPFTLDSWIAGLKAGRSFVTNYPLFTNFEVQGARPGDVLDTAAPTLPGTVSLVCSLPVEKVEIIGDTGLLHLIEPPGGPAKAITSSFEIPRAGLTWVVARATGPASRWHLVDADGLFAQTAPVYLSGDSTAQGNRATRATAVEYFRGHLNSLEELFDENGYFPGASRAAFDTALLEAHLFFDALMSPVTRVHAQSPRIAWDLSRVWPNPAGSDVHLSYRVPSAGGDHAVDVYDTAGRVVRHLFSGSRPAGEYELAWDGRDAVGARVASGVYFISIRPRGAVPVSRKLVLVR